MRLPLFKQAQTGVDEEEYLMREDAPGDANAVHEPGTEITRHTPHHLPWDRFSRWRPKRVSTIGKPPIVAANPDLDDLAACVWKQLKDLNQPPFLFRREGRLCRVEASDTGAPEPVIVDVNRMRFLLVQLFDWIEVKKKKNESGEEEEEVKVRPPNDLAAHLVADPDPPVPTLQRIVTAPIFAANGSLLEKPYDYADGILYLPPKSFGLAELPQHPGEKDIRLAVEFIKRNLLVDFCFAGESEIANCFAALITPLVREMIWGPTPLFWVDKSKGGSGGTLLSSVIAAPILGAPPSGVTAPRDEPEWNRVILSTLLRSPNVFYIDNCNEKLSSESLAHAITAARYEGRIIGSSKNEAADVRCMWIINGNNLRFGWELARRVVRIRIDQKKKRRFVHPNLLAWVIRHRAELLYHLLVLVTAWQVRGCPGPAPGAPDMESFESWRNQVGGILHTAGISGFLRNLDDARREADPESAIVLAFVEAWQRAFGLEPAFVTDLVKIGSALFELPKDAHSAAIRLGLVLHKYENQTYGEWRIQRLPPSQGKTRWRLQRAPKD